MMNASVQVPMLYLGNRLMNGNASTFLLRRFASKLGPDWLAGIATYDNQSMNLTWVASNEMNFQEGMGASIPKMGQVYDALRNGRSWCGTGTCLRRCRWSAAQ